MREIRLFDSLSGELVTVAPGDAIRVEVRTSPVIARGAVDVGSTRPFVLFSFLERYLQREGFATKFLFDSPGGGDALYELAEDLGEGSDDADPDADDPFAEEVEHGARSGRRAGAGPSGMGLLPVSRSDVDRWVNVCFGADREGASGRRRRWTNACRSTTR